MATAAQIKLVQSLRRKCGLNDDVYRDLLRSHGGVESTKDLTNTGVDRIVARLNHDYKLGLKTREKPPRRRGGDPATTTNAQQRLIAALVREIGWDPARLIAFCRNQLGCGYPQTTADASKTIEALKSMRRRGYSDHRPRARQEAPNG